MREGPPFQRPADVIALALVTVLALLIAPICAPLCAMRACSSGMAPEPCHGMASTGADGGEQFVATNKACRTPDFSAVLVKADEKTALLESARNVPAQAPVSRTIPERLGSSLATVGHSSACRVPSELSDALLLTTILRI